MNYLFQMEPWMLPLLMPFGASQETSFVSIEGKQLHVKMGKLFDEYIDLETIADVAPGKWHILGGLGHRVGLKQDMAVLASTKNVVQLHFKEPQALKALGPVYLKISDFYLSLQEPEAFIAALNLALDVG